MDKELAFAWIKELLRLSRLGILRAPEPDIYTTAFVSEFCNQLAINERGLRGMCAWYIFEDDRPGSVRERFETDARKFWGYQQLFKV